MNLPTEILINEISCYLRPKLLYRLGISCKILESLITCYQEQVRLYDTFPLHTSFEHAILNDKYYWVSYAAEIIEENRIDLNTIKSKVIRSIMNSSNSKMFSVLMLINSYDFKLILLKEACKINNTYYLELLTNNNFKNLNDDELDMALYSAMKHSSPYLDRLQCEYMTRDPVCFILTERGLAIRGLENRNNSLLGLLNYNLYNRSTEIEYDMNDQRNIATNYKALKSCKYHRGSIAKIIDKHNYDKIIAEDDEFVSGYIEGIFFDQSIDYKLLLFFKCYKYNMDIFEYYADMYICGHIKLIYDNPQDFRNFIIENNGKNMHIGHIFLYDDRINRAYDYNPYSDLQKQREMYIKKYSILIYDLKEHFDEFFTMFHNDCVRSSTSRLTGVHNSMLYYSMDYEIFAAVCKMLDPHQNTSPGAIIKSYLKRY